MKNLIVLMHQPGLWSDHDSSHAPVHRGHGQRSAGVCASGCVSIAVQLVSATGAPFSFTLVDPSVLLDQGYNFPKRYETSLLGSQMSGVHHAHTGDGCRHLRSEPNARPWGRDTKNVPGSLWCVPTHSHVQT